jgi:hypothetical protein
MDLKEMKQLEEMLITQHYRHQAQQVINWVGHSRPRFNALVQSAVGNDILLAQRAAWPMSNIAQAHPLIVLPHLPALLAAIKKPGVHTAVVRGTMRLLQFVDIPESLHGTVMDCCFRQIENPKEKAAVKAFALTVLKNLSHTYPEIIPEIKTVVAARMDYETPAFKVRARLFLNLPSVR